jgi:hypothetical protein
LAKVKPDAHPFDGPAIANAVRFALSDFGNGGPGAVRHEPIAK